jgi:hypothetical protein
VILRPHIQQPRLHPIARVTVERPVRLVHKDDARVGG